LASPASIADDQPAIAISWSRGRPSRRGTGIHVNRPVLILGWMSRIILPIARSLHRRGVAVDLGSFLPAPPLPSRAICEFRNLSRPDIDRTEFVKQLRRFVTDRGHDMLIPTDDQTLTAITEHYDDFRDLLHIACPPPPITRSVLDKARTLEIARRCGVLVPRSHVVLNSEQLSHLAGELPFPGYSSPRKRKLVWKRRRATFCPAPIKSCEHFPPDASSPLPCSCRSTARGWEWALRF